MRAKRPCLNSPSDRRLLTALVVVVIGTTVTVASARMIQDPEGKPRIWIGGGGLGSFRRERPKWATPANFDGSFLPPGRYPIVDIPPDHPIMHTLYDVKAVEQVSNIRFWAQTGGNVSERGPDSPHVNFRGITDERGRLIVVMSHNTDIPDTWEREGESQEYFDGFSPNGYAIGVNVVLYAMTH
jgi:hypothetical protein